MSKVQRDHREDVQIEAEDEQTPSCPKACCATDCVRDASRHGDASPASASELTDATSSALEIPPCTVSRESKSCQGGLLSAEDSP